MSRRLKALVLVLLTTSSRAALRPNEQVSSVRQLMKEVKRSVGRAVKVLLGNMVIILEMIFEMPTASESSISILEGLKMLDNNNRFIFGLTENITGDRSCEQTWVTSHLIHM